MKQSVIFQRIEASTIFFVSLYLYWYLDFNLIVLILLLFVFDIFMLGYLFSARVGAYIYNFGHSMILPTIILAIGYVADIRLLIGFSLIWFAHIGLDRALGYGLKFTSGFKETHLGHIGKKKL
jgi:hypothetical protein